MGRRLLRGPCVGKYFVEATSRWALKQAGQPYFISLFSLEGSNQNIPQLCPGMHSATTVMPSEVSSSALRLAPEDWHA